MSSFWRAEKEKLEVHEVFWAIAILASLVARSVHIELSMDLC